MVKRKEYDRAIPLLERWYPEALRESHKNAVGISLSLVKCFIAKKQFSKAQALMDSSRVLITAMPVNLPLLEKFYNLQSNYYEAVGNASKAILYNDSARHVANQLTDKTNALIILRAEQKLFEAEKNLKDEQINVQQSRIIFITVIFLLSLSALSILIFLYYKKQTAYRKLVVKSQQWAGIIVPESEKNAQSAESQYTQNALPDPFDLSLMDEIERFIKDKKLYKNPSLTLDILSNELKIKRNYISNAINRCRKVNFNTYINEYRIKEAIWIISDNSQKKISVEDVAFDVGFNSRSVFSRTFKKITGLSPISFIQNK
jgi:YesN/AraC family two-component response regulator